LDNKSPPIAEPPIPNTTIFLKFRAEAGEKAVEIENSSPKRKASLIF